MNSIGSLLIVGALALFNQKQVLKEYRQTVDENFVGYARSLQSKIAAQFVERYGDVQSIAANPWLATGKPQDIVPLLNKYVQVYGIYDGIWVVNPNGAIVASTR